MFPLYLDYSLRAVFVTVKVFTGNRFPLEKAVSFTVYFQFFITVVNAYAAKIRSQKLVVFIACYLDIFRTCSAPFKRPGIQSTPCAFIGSEIHGILNKAAFPKGQVISVDKGIASKH